MGTSVVISNSTLCVCVWGGGGGWGGGVSQRTFSASTLPVYARVMNRDLAGRITSSDEINKNQSPALMLALSEHLQFSSWRKIPIHRRVVAVHPTLSVSLDPEAV